MIVDLMPSNSLDYITIQGFKSIASIEKLALRPINVVIGANGSGKSNFIGVFDFIHEIRAGRLRDYVLKSGGADKVLHFGSKATHQIFFDLSFAKGPWKASSVRRQMIYCTNTKRGRGLRCSTASRRRTTTMKLASGCRIVS